MTSRYALPQEAIDFIKGAGYRVYMRDRADSWAVFCGDDGVAYVQYEPFSGYTVSTCHRPNRVSGTGYQIARHAPVLKEKMLEDALNITVPSWHRGAPAPRKYSGIDEYRESSSFHAAYQEV